MVFIHALLLSLLAHAELPNSMMDSACQMGSSELSRRLDRSQALLQNATQELAMLYEESAPYETQVDLFETGNRAQRNVLYATGAMIAAIRGGLLVQGGRGLIASLRSGAVSTPLRTLLGQWARSAGGWLTQHQALVAGGVVEWAASLAVAGAVFSGRSDLSEQEILASYNDLIGALQGSGLIEVYAVGALTPGLVPARGILDLDNQGAQKFKNFLVGASACDLSQCRSIPPIFEHLAEVNRITREDALAELRDRGWGRQTWDFLSSSSPRDEIEFRYYANEIARWTDVRDHAVRLLNFHRGLRTHCGFSR